MKTIEQFESEAKVRKTVDFVFAIILAIVIQLFMVWKFLFLFAAIYAFLKANLFYSYLKSIPSQSLINTEDLERLDKIENPLERENYVNGIKGGYLTSKWILQFALTFILVTAISSFTKVLFSLAMSYTIWIIVFILFELVTCFLTLKKIWK